jgi:hypothetical protein
MTNAKFMMQVYIIFLLLYREEIPPSNLIMVKRKKFDSGLDSMDPPHHILTFFHIGFRRIECIQTFEVYNIYIHIHIHIH